LLVTKIGKRSSMLITHKIRNNQTEYWQISRTELNTGRTSRNIEKHPNKVKLNLFHSLQVIMDALQNT